MQKPRFRFDGFNDDWEERKLGEIGTLKNGMNFAKDAMGHGYPFVNLQNIFGKNIINVDDLGLAEASDSQLREYSLNLGDVLFVRSSVKLEGVGEAALVPKMLKNTTYSGFIIRFRDEYGLDNNFKRYIFSIGTVREQIIAQATNSANKNINQTVLSNLVIRFPCYEEQEKIGTLFSIFDHLITLQQHKYEAIKELKKNMLQKLFPRNESKNPEIRFNGFTDDWEQRKLGECFDERQERSAKGELISVTINDGIKKFVDLGKHDNSSKDKSNYKRVEIGDIAYNSMRMWQGASGCSSYSGILSPAYTVAVPREGIDSLFFSYMFKRPQMIHIFKVCSQGLTSDTWNLKFPTFSKIEIMMSKIEEQQQIATYFRHLDHFITLQQRKVDELKKLKAAMLKNLFI